eukprot:COSAG01_NODE_524_length_15931_cov_72.340491_17_plen_107_part_00
MAGVVAMLYCTVLPVDTVLAVPGPCLARYCGLWPYAGLMSGAVHRSCLMHVRRAAAAPPAARGRALDRGGCPPTTRGAGLRAHHGRSTLAVAAASIAASGFPQLCG